MTSTVNVINKTGLDLTAYFSTDGSVMPSTAKTLLCGSSAMFTLDGSYMDGSYSAMNLYVSATNSVNSKGYTLTNNPAMIMSGSAMAGKMPSDMTNLYVGVKNPNSDSVTGLVDYNPKNKNILFLRCSGETGQMRITRSNRALLDKSGYGDDYTSKMTSVNTTLTSDMIKSNRTNLLSNLNDMITAYGEDVKSAIEDATGSSDMSWWSILLIIFVIILVIVAVVAGGYYLYKKKMKGGGY